MQSAREAEAIIRMIPDVEAVRVDLDDGTPREVHILAAAGRHPMQIVRDVESALAAKIGKRIDRRAISIAQLRGAREQAFRLALRAVQTRLSCDTAEFQVELALDDAEFVGRASGPASRANKLKLAVEATLDAVVRSLGNRGAALCRRRGPHDDRRYGRRRDHRRTAGRWPGAGAHGRRLCLAGRSGIGSSCGLGCC